MELTFKCSYCGRYGPPGACEGCGAPNQPEQWPASSVRMVTQDDFRHYASILSTTTYCYRSSNIATITSYR